MGTAGNAGGRVDHPRWWLLAICAWGAANGAGGTLWGAQAGPAPVASAAGKAASRPTSRPTSPTSRPAATAPAAAGGGAASVWANIKALQSTDPQAVRAAATALGKTRDRRAIEPLKVVLANEQQAEFIAEVLADMGPAGLAALCDAMTWATGKPLTAAADRLARMGTPEAAEGMRQVMKSGPIDGRRAIVQAAVQAGGALAEEFKALAAADPDKTVSTATRYPTGPTGRTVGTTGRPIGSLPQPNPLTGDRPMPRSADFTGETSIPTLMEGLSSAIAPVRAAAARRLGELRATQAVEALAKAGDSNGASTSTRTAVVEALVKIGGKQAVAALVSLVQPGRSPITQEAPVTALGKMEGPEAADGLLAVAQSPEPTIRVMALRWLAWRGDTRARAPLEKCCHELGGGDPPIQAALALAALDDRQALTLLLPLLPKNPVAGVRAEYLGMAKALTDAHQVGLVNSLLAVMKGDEALPRRTALHWIWQTGDKRAIPVLQEMRNSVTGVPRVGRVGASATRTRVADRAEIDLALHHLEEREQVPAPSTQPATTPAAKPAPAPAATPAGKEAKP